MQWQKCRKHAQEMNLDIVSIGILPTVRDEMLNLKYLSKQNRYASLNKQVMAARDGEPVHLNITGQDNLKVEHEDVMLEAAATSISHEPV